MNKSVITQIFVGLLFFGIHFTLFGENEQAFLNWKKKAEKDDVEAMAIVGRAYAVGWGTKVDYYQAMKWYRKAADRGNVEAMRNIGVFYQNGNGVTKNVREAVKWYEKAAAKGDSKAKEYLAAANKDLLAKENLRQQREKERIIKENERKKLAEEQRRKEQMRKDQIERDYQHGRLFRLNGRYSEALPLLQRAVDAGHAYAMYDLAIAYSTGQGKYDVIGGARLFIKAAERGVEDAFYDAGNAYANGVGCEMNLEKARYWYVKGMSAGPWKSLCRDDYMKLQRGIIPDYVYYKYSAPTNSSTYTSDPAPAPREKEAPETRMVRCKKCNGTGMLTGEERFYKRSTGKCGGCSVAGDHVFIHCPTCGKYHCSHIDSHYHCDDCGGTGMIKQHRATKNGIWISEYSK